MAYTFYGTGPSDWRLLLEVDKVELAREILQQAKRRVLNYS